MHGVPPQRPRLSRFASVGLGLLGLCVVSSVVAAVLIPGVVQASRGHNENAAIGALKTIRSAQAVFRENDEDADGAPDYATLDELSATSVIDPILGGGQKQGYAFQVGVSPTSPQLQWLAVASPVSPGTTGDRYFVTNHTGTIYYSVTAPFTITPDCAIPSGALPLLER